ncbi:MAG: hypothetical protein ACO1OB_25855, partial [Archangium sp.]
MSRMLMAAAVVCCALPAFAQDDADAKKVAETYLNALSGTGDEAGKDLLLGGVTMNAQLFILENWKIKSKDPVRKEEGDLAHAVQLMSALDKSGRTALTKLMGVESVGDDLKMTEVGPDEAAKLLAPTKERAAEFAKYHAVLSYALRVGKEVYWHPKNPMRAVLGKAGTKGKYSVEVHRWTITTVEGPSKQVRDWPLR